MCLRIGTDGGLLWMRQWTFGFHKMREISWLAEELLASQNGLCSMELISAYDTHWTCTDHVYRTLWCHTGSCTALQLGVTARTAAIPTVLVVKLLVPIAWIPGQWPDHEHSGFYGCNVHTFIYIYTYLLLLTPWSRLLPEKLTGPQLVKKFPAFHGKQRFIAAFTTARHLSLSWARSIQSTPPSHFSEIHFNIIVPSTPGSYKWSGYLSLCEVMFSVINHHRKMITPVTNMSFKSVVVCSQHNVKTHEHNLNISK
jgi:hypothetical protein